ncbi:hypothetical protein [Hymenobacter sp. B81]|uniref:hypothetical protein n=1 Tax=Hymenobacter sp. B81 TaxID=3344878 RepID=UPI0037DC0704
MKHPTKAPDAAARGLAPAIRAYWGLSQAELGRLLGLCQQHVAQAETDARPLPPDAYYRLRTLARLLPAPGAPEPAPPALDPAPLLARRAACLDQARRLRYRLGHELPGRAAPATRLLAQAAELPAALAATEADAPLPERRRADQQIELRLLHNAALTELETRSGPGPVALLRARLAGLEAEAAALGQVLGEALGEVPNEVLPLPEPEAFA